MAFEAYLEKLEILGHIEPLYEITRSWTISNEERKDARSCYSSLLYAIPEARQTPAVCRAFVLADPHNFYYVPHHLRTEELCDIAVARSSESIIEDIPAPLRTRARCLASLVLPFWCPTEGAFGRVPPEIADDAFFVAFVEHSRDFKTVPFARRSPAVLAALSRRYKGDFEELIDEIDDAALLPFIALAPLMLEHVPTGRQTRAIVAAAIAADPRAAAFSRLPRCARAARAAAADALRSAGVVPSLF